MSGHPHDDPRWLDEPRNVDKLVYGLYIVCAAMVLADLFYDKHPHFEFEHWFGFHAFYGFFACVVLVVLAKGLRLLLMRNEHYYDPAEAAPEPVKEDH